MADGICNGEDLNRFKVVELKEWLKRRGIKTIGKKKADLIKRYVVVMYISNFLTVHVTLAMSENI